MKRSEQAERMRMRLQGFRAQDPEERLLSSLVRLIEDPLRPRTEDGRFRLNPILLLLAAILALAVGTFLVLSFGGL
jgi:hypothetical protein